jgi:predicted TIM-barrel fold metal-dependent hydrolase
MKPYVFKPRVPSDGEAAILGAYHGRPAFDVPAGSCDCHVHIFGPRTLYPLANERTFVPGLASVDDVLALHQRIGIERVVIVQASVHGTDNRCLVDSIADLTARGRQARGIAVVAEGTSLATLRDLHLSGVRGLRVNLHSFSQTNEDVATAALVAAASMAAQVGWHVQIYTTLRVIQAISDTIGRLPVLLVIDHFGLADPSAKPDQPGLRELLALLSQGKVYVKLSAPYRILDTLDGTDGRALVRSLVDANPDQLLWGSDWPHTGPWPGRTRERDGVEPFHPVDNGAQLDLLAGWTTPEERQRILVTNAARLYDF